MEYPTTRMIIVLNWQHLKYINNNDMVYIDNIECKLDWIEIIIRRIM